MAIFTSPENMIFNGIDIAATFDKDGGYFVVQNVEGRVMDNIELNLTSVPGRMGSIYRNRDVRHRILTVQFALKARTHEELRKRLESLNALLLENQTNEIRFADEMDRVYYGTVQNIEQNEEKSTIHKGTITIICSDPLKYGDEVIKDFVDGEVTVQNNGAVPAEPIFEFDVLEDITYLDVFTGDDYMRIGRPTEDGLPPIHAKELVAHWKGNTTTGWTPTSTAEGNTPAGSITTNGYTLRVDSYGTGSGWHGPAVVRQLPVQLDGFEVQIRFAFEQRQADQLGKIAVELLGATGNVVGRMTMFKSAKGSGGPHVKIRAGANEGGHELVNTPGDNGRAFSNFNGVMRLLRIGDRWEGYVAQIDYNRQVQHSRAFGSFNGTQYDEPITAVRLHFAQLGTNPVPTQSVYEFHIFRRQRPEANRVPVIATAGDIIRIDHGSSLISVNGEPRNDLKDFGATYWDVKKGITTILSEPKDGVNGSVRYREGYL